MYIYVWINQTFTTCLVVVFCSLFTEIFHTKHFRVKKEQNITSKHILSAWFIHFSTYFYHLVRFSKIYHFSLSLSLYLYIYIYRERERERERARERERERERVIFNEFDQYRHLRLQNIKDLDFENSLNKQITKST